ncbi:MAG: hypothetical protein SH850_04085 [Planctomycetaceae bacterium]|nr:hypothetical protein [Planctomycetaceae bacterium]
MRRTWSLVALLVIASGSLGCQQLGRRSSCGAPPDCGCGCTATVGDACHCGSGQPACGTNGEMIPSTPPAGQHRPASTPYEDVPQKPPMTRTAPPPPPPEGAQAPRPLELLLQ